MTNKEFDKWLRESLSSVQPDLNPQDWDDFVHQVEESESKMDSDFDEAIRNAVAGVGIGSGPDWSRMEHQLDADESQFDQHVKDTISNIKVPYNPTTWPTLDAKLSEDDRVRRRLLNVKILEIAAVLIVFMTFYNFYPSLKSSVIEPAGDMIRKELSRRESSPHSSGGNLNVPGSLNNPVVESTIIASNDLFTPGEVLESPSIYKNNSTIPPAFVNSPDATSSTRIVESHVVVTSLSTNANALLASTVAKTAVVSQHPTSESFNSLSTNSQLFSGRRLEDIHAFAPGVLSNVEESIIVTPLASKILPVLQRTSRVRFGMMAAADVNTLFFPEEHFYSQGRSINFSEKEIVAGGYSAGASLLFDFNNFIIESGLTYSSKNFGPDRKLFIGSTADRHSLDFENITLNVISLPVYLHWKLDSKGAWRIYATAGAAMHVIANAHYDLLSENIYTSSAAAQSPQQLQNETEVQRVREHMLDGAKFNSKGYLTAAGGFGVERYLNSRMSLFVQPMYHYQIPFFGLIDQNGKHLQNGSVLFGTRVSL